MKVYTELGERHSRAKNAEGEPVEITYYIRAYVQPRRNKILGALYHKYDMAFSRIPGARRLEDFLMARHDKKCQGDCSYGQVWSKARGTRKQSFCGYIPLMAQQDLRCFELNRKNRAEIGVLDIPKETYNGLRHGDYVEKIFESGLTRPHVDN